MSSQDDQLRLTAQIVDQFSGPLREMTKSVHSFQDMLRGGTKQTIKDNKEHAKLQKDLNEQFVNTGRTISGIVTPAMGALGLSVGGAGASIVALIANLKNAGGEFYKLQGAMARTGLSLPELDAQSRMISKITGQTVEASQAQLSSLGDVARQLSRNYAPTMQALEGTFNNLHGLITKMSGDTAAQAIDDFMAYYESHPASPDQQRKLLSAVGINPDLAHASADQIRKTLEQQRQFVSANPLLDQDTRKKLRDAFDELDDSSDGFGRHMLAAFGGDTVKIVNNLAGAINSLAGALGDQVKKELSDIKSIMDGIDTVGRHLGFRDDSPEQKKFDEDNKGKVIPNLLQQHRSPSTAPTGPGVFPGGSYHPTSFMTGGSESDSENMLSRGVKRGTLDAFREWFASTQGGGVQNANYTTGGTGGGNSALRGGSPKFGNSEFPNLGGGGGGGVGGGGGGGTGNFKMPSGTKAQNAQAIYSELRRLGHTHEQAVAALGHVSAVS
jgi:hypothetical protein